jgi:hypothetical protein
MTVGEDSRRKLVFPVRRLAPDGLEAWKQVVERGYEGYVAKDEASPYEGGPTRAWLNVKVPGWTGGRTDGGGGSAYRRERRRRVDRSLELPRLTTYPHRVPSPSRARRT